MKTKAIFKIALTTMIAFGLTSSLILTAMASIIPGVPDHGQTRWYYCGPASLEDVFDFYGPDIPQTEIADAARTDPNPPAYGTYTSDMRRAAHFSDLSTSRGNELPGSITGYTARGLGYVAFEAGFRNIGRINALKPLIDAGYPIIVLQYEALPDKAWGHYRVVVGYDDATQTVYVEDPNPNPESLSYTEFEELWDYSWNMWGLIVCPWEVIVSSPATVIVGDIFTVTATVTYPCPPPFPTSYSASSSQATIQLPVELSLAPGETVTKTLGTGTMAAGSSQTVQWNVRADSAGTHTISVEGEGRVSGSVPSFTVTLPDGSPYTYPGYSYTDRIGGAGSTSVTVPGVSAHADVLIEHTYRGDLIVDIGVGDPASPDWSQRIWNGEGGAADDLDLTVDLSAATAHLPPSSSKRWWLQVYDQYGGDQGQIVGFTITYLGTTYTSGDPPVPIDDLETSYAYIPSLAEASAHVFIEHTYQGNLIVDIGVGDPESPDWSQRIWNRDGGSADDLDLTVDLSAATAYLPPTTGNWWFVKVYDATGGDTGQITEFTITYQGTTYTSIDVPVPIIDFGTKYAYIPTIGPSVHVYIEHTYRGDLIVDIGFGDPSSPTWSQRIWNGEGGSLDNLDLRVELPDYIVLYLPYGTKWFLQVYDRYSGDQGQIMEFTITYRETVYSSSDPPVPINDFETSYAYIPSLAEASAHVFIEHTYQGDLIVDIGVADPASPEWSQRIWNGEGGSLDNLDLTVDLSAVAGHLPPQYTPPYRWFLQVYDRYGGDQGQIVEFTITYLGTTYTSDEVPVPINDLETSYAYIPSMAAQAHVFIEHTYQGDLIVDIGVGDPAGPDWSQRIWNGEGGAADDLDLTVDLSAPTAYLPPTTSDRWFVKVYDAAGGDTGQITKFTITYLGTTYYSTDPPVPVNDFQTSYAFIPTPTLYAQIYIKHTYRGDLIVDLGVDPPIGRLVYTRIWNGEGGAADNLDLIVIGSDVPLLLRGDYLFVLRVRDRYLGDRGKIAVFTITYRGKRYPSPDVPVPVLDLQTSYARIKISIK